MAWNGRNESILGSKPVVDVVASPANAEEADRPSSRDEGDASGTTTTSTASPAPPPRRPPPAPPANVWNGRNAGIMKVGVGDGPVAKSASGGGGNGGGRTATTAATTTTAPPPPPPAATITPEHPEDGGPPSSSGGAGGEPVAVVAVVDGPSCPPPPPSSPSPLPSPPSSANGDVVVAGVRPRSRRRRDDDVNNHHPSSKEDEATNSTAGSTAGSTSAVSGCSDVVGDGNETALFPPSPSLEGNTVVTTTTAIAVVVGAPPPPPHTSHPTPSNFPPERKKREPNNNNNNKKKVRSHPHPPVSSSSSAAAKSSSSSASAAADERGATTAMAVAGDGDGATTTSAHAVAARDGADALPNGNNNNNKKERGGNGGGINHRKNSASSADGATGNNNHRKDPTSSSADNAANGNGGRRTWGGGNGNHGKGAAGGRGTNGIGNGGQQQRHQQQSGKGHAFPPSRGNKKEAAAASSDDGVEADRRPMCTFHARGMCNRGASCAFRHDSPAPSTAAAPLPLPGGDRCPVAPHGGGDDGDRSIDAVANAAAATSFVRTASRRAFDPHKAKAIQLTKEAQDCEDRSAFLSSAAAKRMWGEEAEGAAAEESNVEEEEEKKAEESRGVADPPFFSIDVECIATGYGSCARGIHDGVGNAGRRGEGVPPGQYNDNSHRYPGRVALVDSDGNVLSDILIRPPGDGAGVVSYLTPLTGLTAEVCLGPDAVPLDDAVRAVRALLPTNGVVVGQAIGHDVTWLGLRPGTDFDRAVDISDIFRQRMPAVLAKAGEVVRKRAEGGGVEEDGWPSSYLDRSSDVYLGFATRYRHFSLRHVCLNLLGEDIQKGVHDPVTDARYSLMLFHKYRDSSPTQLRIVRDGLHRAPITPGFAAEKTPVIDGVCVSAAGYPYKRAARKIWRWYSSINSSSLAAAAREQ